MGNWDSLRSLLAQRKYIGDEVMQQLWYTEHFLDAATQYRNTVRAELKTLQKNTTGQVDLWSAPGSGS